MAIGLYALSLPDFEPDPVLEGGVVELDKEAAALPEGPQLRDRRPRAIGTERRQLLDVEDLVGGVGRIL